MKRPTLILLGLATALSLAGCGKLGDLERPGPVGGADAGPAATVKVRTVDPRDRNSDPSPSGSSRSETGTDPRPQ